MKPNLVRDVLIPRLNRNAVRNGVRGIRLEYAPDQLARMEAVLKDNRRLMAELKASSKPKQ